MKKSLLQNELGGALGESLKSVLPIFAIVLLLSISLVPMNSGILVMFLFGTIMLIVGYIVALTITFFVPRIYTGIAFDSGGVASGPMTTTFMLPFAIGACEAVGGNIMTDAFGIVAMVAMTPLIAIQALGLHSKIRQKRLHKKIKSELLLVDDDMIFYEGV